MYIAHVHVDVHAVVAEQTRCTLYIAHCTCTLHMYMCMYMQTVRSRPIAHCTLHIARVHVDAAEQARVLCARVNELEQHVVEAAGRA